MTERTELINQARKIVRLWTEQEGFNADELDVLVQKVVAYDSVASSYKKAAEEATLQVPKETAEIQKQAMTIARQMCIGVVREWDGSGKSVDQLVFRLQTTHFPLPQEIEEE